MDAAERKARAKVKRAQEAFERAQSAFADARQTRRAQFEEGRAAGLSMRDIGDEVGLHYTRVAQILREDRPA